MHMRSRLFKASLMLACSSLSVGSIVPAWAQPAPPPGQQGPSSNGADPSTLAGSLAEITGTVSYHAAGATEWSPATQNFPVTSGNAYWTEPQASATIDIGDDELVMDGGTELDVTTLDAHQFVASLPQGALFLGLRDLPDGQALTVTTPRGEVQITQPGEYEIVAGDTNNPTSVTTVAGSATVTATGLNLTISAQQTGSITGSSSFQGQVFAMQQDQFLQTQLSRFQPPRQQPPQEVAQQVRYMTGGAQLAQYGSWSSTQQYGQLWYPNDVPSGWTPYSDGHWSYIAPWGWTWVDAEPWGFAPFHYGRWINDGGRWGWMAAAPGVAYGGGYPVYAPALVGFVGVGADILAGAAFGFGVGLYGGGGIGWFPLGFRDPFVPWYHVSDGYFRGINRFSGLDIRNISITNYRNITINHFSNARFARVAPASAFASGRAMQGFARPLPAADLGRVRPFEAGRLPVAPTAATPGLSRAVAARYHVNLPAHAPGHEGPGPQIRTDSFRPGERPALRPAALPGNVRPAAGGMARGARPGEAPGVRPGFGNRPGEAARPGEAGRPGGAPGPAINRTGARPGGLPALRAASPNEAPPGIARPHEAGSARTRPEGERLGADRSAGARPGEARPGEARPGEARPSETRAGETRPGEARSSETRPGAGRPDDAGRPAGSRHDAVRPQPVRRPVSRPEEARPETRPAQRPEARPAPRPEARPAPRPEVRHEARPAPRPEAHAAPHPAPHGDDHRK